MTGGFEANVPARKPRTKIARVISELTAEPTEDTKSDADPAVVEDPSPAARDSAARPRGDGARDAAADTSGRAFAVSSAPPKILSDTVSPVSGGREQIARLRERLAATAHPRTGALEPQRTAAAVRDMVEGLRDRLETTAVERTELARALEEARAALAHRDAELQRERRAREGLEAQAEERRRIADDAVAEAEALAAERDQVLGELTEHRRLEGEQTGLLTEIEAALAQRDAEREAAARELTAARDLASLRAVEVADLEARVQDEAAGCARAEARCRVLEAEIARLSDARDALDSIEAVLGRRREERDDGAR